MGVSRGGPVAAPTGRGRAATAAAVLLVASVVVLLPDGMTRWHLPKLALAALAVAMAAHAPRVGRLPRTVVVVLGVGTALLVVTALLGSAPLTQLLGRWPRYDGLLGLGVLVAVAAASARLLGPGVAAGALRAWRAAVATASILLAAVSALETLGARPIPSDLDRPGALLGNASDQGLVAVAFAGLLLPRLLSRVSTRGERALLAAAVTANGASVVLSGSRGAVAALIVMAVAASVLLARRAQGAADRARAVAIPLLLALVVLPLASIPGLSGRSARDGAIDNIGGGRLVILRAALDVLRLHPDGVGPSGFVDAVPQVLDAAWYGSVGEGVRLDSPHNVVLQILVSAGWAGGLWLVVATVVVIVGARRGRAARTALDRTLHDGAILAAVGLVVGLQFAFTAPATGILGAMCVGVLVAAPVDAASPPAVRRWLLVAVGWGAALLLTVTALAEVPLRQALDRAEVGDVAGATEAFAVARALRPWDPAVDDIAAQSFAFLAVNGIPDAATEGVAAGRRALARTPFAVGAADATAVCLLVSGDADGALEVLAPLLESAPMDPILTLRAGTALATLGRPAEAVPYLERSSDATGAASTRELLDLVRAEADR